MDVFRSSLSGAAKDTDVAEPKLTLAFGVEPYPGYRLTRFLGRGACGEVWRATRPDGGAAALKFLPSDSQIAAPQEIRALQALRQLRHKNLLGMDNIWSCPGYLVVVMEMADGSLLDLLGVYQNDLHGPIPPDHICSFLRQAAAAIDFLNARQHPVNGQRVSIRHCDVKPSNLLVMGETVKLSDFSLAVQATSPMVQNRRAGTMSYAAPEVFRGWLSERTDQYSLAATYFHLRTGDIPMPTVSAKFDARHAPAALDLTGFAAEERAILARALAPTPQDRWPSCSEFMQRLTRCFAPRPAVCRQ
jgi:serine/threonine protein kinase, bacterial